MTTVKLSRNGDNATALVTVEDPSFADTTCAGLPSELAEGLGCPGPTITKVPISFTAGCFKHRITRSVLCSWLKPIVQVTLYYVEESAARTVLEMFKTGAYTIQGKMIHTALSRIQDLYSTEWRVYLHRVPAYISYTDIRSMFSLMTQPYSIEVGAPTYEQETGSAGKVKMTLAQIAPLAHFSVHATTGSLHKATGVYVPDADAARAMDLDGTRLAGTSSD